MSRRVDIDDAIRSWRDAERRLRNADPGSTEQASAIAAMRVARRAYEAVIAAGGGRRARPPAR
jgi:hypothetical protein